MSDDLGFAEQGRGFQSTAEGSWERHRQSDPEVIVCSPHAMRNSLTRATLLIRSSWTSQGVNTIHELGPRGACSAQAPSSFSNFVTRKSRAPECFLPCLPLKVKRCPGCKVTSSATSK